MGPHLLQKGKAESTSKAASTQCPPSPYCTHPGNQGSQPPVPYCIKPVLYLVQEQRHSRCYQSLVCSTLIHQFVAPHVWLGRQRGGAASLVAEENMFLREPLRKEILGKRVLPAPLALAVMSLFCSRSAVLKQAARIFAQ